MIGALLGWFIPVAGFWFVLGMLVGARSEQNADHTIVSFAAAAREDVTTT